MDRVKNIMKLAQGEYVALEFVESMHSLCAPLQQLCAVGDSREAYLVGIVVPEPAPFAALVASVWGKPVDPNDKNAMARAAQDPAVHEALLKEMSVEAGRRGLKGWVASWRS